MREIEICIGDICFRASLLEKEAPKTCQVYWDAMPIEVEAHHGEIAGSEIYSNFITSIGEVEMENYYLLNELKPGDITGSGGGLAIFYGDVSPEPWPENVFAKVTKKEDLKKLRKAGYKLWLKPGTRLTINRVDEP